MEEAREFGFETRQVHAGQRPDPNTGARAVPIYQTTSYVFEDPESAAAYFNLQEYGNTYSRIMNPTVAVFEERMANLEGGCGAVAFASGIAAQAAALFTLLQPGDHVVSSSALYGGTVNQFKHLLRKMNVDLTWVDPDDRGRVEGGRPREHQGLLRRDDRQPAAATCSTSRRSPRSRTSTRLPLIVDNTFATPYLCRPIEWGADIVVHSATKFIGGHGTSIGGVVVDSGRVQLVERPLPGDRRSVARVSRAAVPRDVRHVRLPDEAARRDAARSRRGDEPVQRVPLPAGARDAVAADGASRRERRRGRRVSSSRTSWRRTSPTRVCRRAAIARSSTSICRAARVRSSRSTAAAAAPRGQDFIRGVTLWSHLANVGDSKSLIIHPASTTHRQLNDDELRAAGVGPGTIRLSVGTESIDDLIWDLEQGFARVARRRRRARRHSTMSPRSTWPAIRIR